MENWSPWSSGCFGGFYLRPITLSWYAATFSGMVSTKVPKKTRQSRIFEIGYRYKTRSTLEWLEKKVHTHEKWVLLGKACVLWRILMYSGKMLQQLSRGRALLKTIPLSFLKAFLHNQSQYSGAQGSCFFAFFHTTALFHDASTYDISCWEILSNGVTSFPYTSRISISSSMTFFKARASASMPSRPAPNLFLLWPFPHFPIFFWAY